MKNPNGPSIEQTDDWNDALAGQEAEQLLGAAHGSVAGVIFAVSNDGGKTGVAWRENVYEAFAYLDMQNVNGSNYAVVAVRKPLTIINKRIP